MTDSIVNNYKYDAEYISYIRNGNSAAVLITRDLVRSVNTIGKWVDIIESNIRDRIDGRIDFNISLLKFFLERLSRIIPMQCQNMIKNILLGKQLVKI